jgi:DDE_Tnp_1-associated
MDDLSASAKPQLRLLLDHFSKIKDTRQLWKVVYPLREILFHVVCGTIASGDDYDDIVDWGTAHLGFLRGFAEFHHGIPCADWLRTLMNRINPDLFKACFSSWVAECWPDKPDLVAIDGKTSRRSHDPRDAAPARCRCWSPRRRGASGTPETCRAPSRQREQNSRCSCDNGLSALLFPFLIREIFKFEGATSWALVRLSQSARTTCPNLTAQGSLLSGPTVAR